mmetsp:Transcript_64089/g.178127  ORF Transcript_64089/g.178127 Transcript_64089/m.178127 type:complete len:218 (+) Transcript_64089:2-655(+)
MMPAKNVRLMVALLKRATSRRRPRGDACASPGSGPPALASSSLDQRVGEEQHQGDDEAVDRQRLHEGQREEQHAAQVVGDLRLPADAIDAASRSDALADSRADRREADGEAGAHRRKRRDPHAALVRMRACGSGERHSAERRRRQRALSRRVRGSGRALRRRDESRGDRQKDCGARQHDSTREHEETGGGHRTEDWKPVRSMDAFPKSAAVPLRQMA